MINTVTNSDKRIYDLLVIDALALIVSIVLYFAIGFSFYYVMTVSIIIILLFVVNTFVHKSLLNKFIDKCYYGPNYNNDKRYNTSINNMFVLFVSIVLFMEMFYLLRENTAFKNYYIIASILLILTAWASFHLYSLLYRVYLFKSASNTCNNCSIRNRIISNNGNTSRTLDCEWYDKVANSRFFMLDPSRMWVILLFIGIIQVGNNLIKTNASNANIESSIQQSMAELLTVILVTIIAFIITDIIENKDRFKRYFDLVNESNVNLVNMAVHSKDLANSAASLKESAHMTIESYKVHELVRYIAEYSDKEDKIGLTKIIESGVFELRKIMTLNMSNYVEQLPFYNIINNNHGAKYDNISYNHLIVSRVVCDSINAILKNGLNMFNTKQKTILMPYETLASISSAITLSVMEYNKKVKRKGERIKIIGTQLRPIGWFINNERGERVDYKKGWHYFVHNNIINSKKVNSDDTQNTEILRYFIYFNDMIYNNLDTALRSKMDKRINGSATIDSYRGGEIEIKDKRVSDRYYGDHIRKKYYVDNDSRLILLKYKEESDIIYEYLVDETDEKHVKYIKELINEGNKVERVVMDGIIDINDDKKEYEEYEEITIEMLGQYKKKTVGEIVGVIIHAKDNCRKIVVGENNINMISNIDKIKNEQEEEIRLQQILASDEKSERFKIYDYLALKKGEDYIMCIRSPYMGGGDYVAVEFFYDNPIDNILQDESVRDDIKEVKRNSHNQYKGEWRQLKENIKKLFENESYQVVKAPSNEEIQAVT